MVNIEGLIEKVASFSSEDNSLVRLPFTDASKRANKYIGDIMDCLGLTVYRDKYGTILGHLDGELNESIVIGSHYDTVVNAGKYDGVAGILVGLFVAYYFIENNIKPRYSLDIIALNDEEGVRFTNGFLSSRAVCNILEEDDFVDKLSNVTLTTLLQSEMYGNDTITLKDRLANAVQYLEVHIEQGNILESNRNTIGIVDSIVGIKRAFIKIRGQSNHAGTTPMKGRDDSLVGACKIIASIPEITQKYENAVCTVGYVSNSPNVVNVISNYTEFSIDIRSNDAMAIEQIYKDIRAYAESLKLEVIIDISTNEKPVMMDKDIMNKLMSISNDLGYPTQLISSGAGHDAQIFAKKMKTAMIFIPSKGGVSHTPNEFSETSDIKSAAQIVIQYVK